MSERLWLGHEVNVSQSVRRVEAATHDDLARWWKTVRETPKPDGCPLCEAVAHPAGSEKSPDPMPLRFFRVEGSGVLLLAQKEGLRILGRP